MLPLLFLLAACTPEESCADPVALADANNYAYTGVINVPSLPTAAGLDLRICWDAVVEDLQCHALDPAADVDTLAIVRFSTLTEAEVAAGLTNDTLQQSDVSGYLTYTTVEDTCAQLSGFSLFGTQVDVPSEYQASYTYLLLLQTGSDIGKGVRALAFLDPQDESTVTDVSVPNACGSLDFTVDLATLDPVPMCAEGPWVLDWSTVTTDGQGNPFNPDTLDNLLLAFYEGMTVADVQANFLDIEVMATTRWEATLTGEPTVDLSTAVTDDGTAFTGFTGEGVWGLALRNTLSYNPAPAFLTILEPTE